MSGFSTSVLCQCSNPWQEKNFMAPKLKASNHFNLGKQKPQPFCHTQKSLILISSQSLSQRHGTIMSRCLECLDCYGAHIECRLSLCSAAPCFLGDSALPETQSFPFFSSASLQIQNSTFFILLLFFSFGCTVTKLSPPEGFQFTQ